jgi:indolepyruvate ferredoxin oxidoreductase
MPPGGVHIRWPDAALEQEARLFDYKWYAALAYVRANKLNHNVIEGPNDRFGIIASGKAYNDTRQALADLGWTTTPAAAGHPAAQGQRGVAAGGHHHARVRHRAARDPGGGRKAPGHRIPAQGRAVQLAPDVRPNVLGKFDEVEGDHSGGEWSMPNPSANWLLRAKADLTPAIIAKAIAKR